MHRLMGNDSDSDHSDVDSLTESEGSVQIEYIDPVPVRRQLRETKKSGGSTGTQFMQCCVEMPNVSVQDAWAFFCNHSVVANHITEILERFAYVEGDGEAGSIYVTSYTPKYTKAGEDKFVMNRVEVKDEMSHLHAVRCVGGKYSKRYKLYLSFIQVIPDEAFGDSSCIVTWRLEYQLRSPDSTPPKDSMAAHKFSMELFRDMHNSFSQVERPLFDHSHARAILKPYRLRGKQGIIANAELRTGVSAQLSRKSRVQSLIKTNGAIDGDGENKRWTGRKPSDNKCREVVGVVGRGRLGW